MGVVGLGLISLTAPAMAAPNMVIVCHDGSDTGTGWEPLQFNVNGLNGHDGHASDIIPPNNSIPLGLNWTNAGKIIYIANCAPLPPGETPPVYDTDPVDTDPVDTDPVDTDPVDTDPVDTDPVDTDPVDTDPVDTGTNPPPAQGPASGQMGTSGSGPAPLASSAKAPAAAAVSRGTNQGFNAQTAVGGAESAPTWLAGLSLMLGAGALVAVRRRSQEQAG
jgi:hypothetical protein